MNLERSSKIPERLLNPKHLLGEASDFANVLAAGRWNHLDIQEVEMTRRIVVSSGHEVELLERDTYPIYDAITISFSAIKRYIDTHSDDPEDSADVVSTYKISSTTSQELSIDEMPSNVLEQILQDAEEPGNLLYRDPLESDVKPIKTLDDYSITRNQEVVYEIDHEGEIDDYTLRYFYALGDENVHEIEYTYSDSAIIWSPTRLADGTEGEKKPFALPLLKEYDLESETKNIDHSFEELLKHQDVLEMNEYSLLPQEEHIRRMLGMIGMVSSGIADRPTKVLSRLRGWYNNIYDYLLHRWERKP